MKLKITARCATPFEERQENSRISPDLPEPKGEGPLAIVGGGPSLLHTLDEIRDFPGDIWAVNQTAQYLREQGIDCFFFTLEPSKTVSRFCSGKAVLHHHCNPNTFKAAGECYKTTGAVPGPTTMVAGCYLGLKAGYDHISLYGGDSSYEGSSHVYRNVPIRDLVQVDCGGPYLTKLEMILQAEELARVIKAFPNIFENRSGGFLKALLEHGDYDVTHAVKAIHERIEHG